jgi:hypothetical protein
MVVSRLMVLRLLRSRLKSGVYLRECDPSSVRQWGPDLTDSDDEIVEALKSKKFKVITITHGQPISPRSLNQADNQSIHPLVSYHPQPESPNSSRLIPPIP